MPPSSANARQTAFCALRLIDKGQDGKGRDGAFADVALDRVLQASQLEERDRGLATELVYGSVRRRRTLDALIDQFAKKPAQQQPPDLRLILHLGFYQLHYLDQIPASAAVDTTVDLAKQNGLRGLAGFVNGLLRQYLRSSQAIGTEGSKSDVLVLPADPIARLGVQHSYPDWIVQLWVDQFGLTDAEKLCAWMNRSPHLDIRVNPLRASIETVTAALKTAGVQVEQLPYLPQALRLSHAGAIQRLPGFQEGWWTVQDASAQWVSYIVDPQPGETIVDACAAPGGKTTHLAELMQDQGTIWAFDRYASRLKKVQANAARLQLHSIHLQATDSRHVTSFTQKVSQTALPESVSQVTPEVTPEVTPGISTESTAEIPQAIVQTSTQPSTQAFSQTLTQLSTQALNQVSTQASTPVSTPVSTPASTSASDHQLVDHQLVDHQLVDRVLIDAPCSGLGTLHRHADARWRQTPATVEELAQLQSDILQQAATWVKPDGILVYATCTLHPDENEAVIDRFLHTHPDWQLTPLPAHHPAAAFINDRGYFKLLPHQHNMDGFFVARLTRH